MYKVDMREAYLENDFTRIWISNGILVMEYKPRLVMNIEIAKQIASDRLKVSNGVSRPILLDARNFVSMDRATMKFYKTKDVVQYVTSAAFLTGNALGSLAGNIFLTLEKPLVPTKLFTDEQKAIAWLEKYKFLN
ncbi:MAG TPA: hypothetical protein VLB84_15650 [Bacteroidia bacterium]|nr:hypothetical protein [Bacteroidia bacterium]